MADAIDPAKLKKAETLFRGPCDFALGADTPSRIPPPTIGEIAFSGRSNVGKSSLINALTDRKGLARSSNTPGRTQQLNFFDLGGKFYLVDLPGYGYAAAPDANVDAWNDMVQAYLRGRPTLKWVCLLVDARHGLKDSDRDAMDMLEDARAAFVIVLTKADKVKKAELETCRTGVEAELQGKLGAHPQIFVTSAEKKQGIGSLRVFLTPPDLLM